MPDEMKQKADYQMEAAHLAECLSVIRKNIQLYDEKLSKTKEMVQELFDHYHSGNPELHSELAMGIDWQAQLERTVRKNKLAENRPYFGRIDYVEEGAGQHFSLYIGKQGVARDVSEILIVDWRAPVSSVYYESDIGAGSYPSPEGETIDIALLLKRTYEIEHGKLRDYYDTEVIANDEFLTKYLAKNKEVVLGEIIATIQKEQDQIIRDTPWHSVIVQGVAGSGKTTVAMHRISYLLYNYKEKLREDAFYIIGSNKTLLNYIVSVLPNLDVYQAKQMTMSEFFLSLLEDCIPQKKRKYRPQNILRPENQEGILGLKGSLAFFGLLEQFIKEYEKAAIPQEDVFYQGELLYAKQDVADFMDSFSMYSLQVKMEVINQRIVHKVQQVNEMQQEEKAHIRAEVKKFKEYFGKPSKKIDLIDFYIRFLRSLAFWQDGRFERAAEVVLERVYEGRLDLYDLAFLSLLKKRLTDKNDFDFVSHIVIDEAQDFGVSIFQVLRTIFPNCNFTIMGDVSQNIYYDWGMNDWRELREQVFDQTRDKFYTLSKSYRNTIEISEFAGSILKKCTFETYEIHPIVRHGSAVQIVRAEDAQELYRAIREILTAWKAEGYDTMAVVCRDIEEAREAEGHLKADLPLNELPEKPEEIQFVQGIMILPVHLTKGLEFDAVLLFNPSEARYPYGNASAKLLYVAVTRALHACKIVCREEICTLLA